VIGDGIAWVVPRLGERGYGQRFVVRCDARGGIKSPAAAGWVVLADLSQGSGETPDSDKTVLRSRVGRNYRQLPARRAVTREPTAWRNRLLTGYIRFGIG
jgi:hypothetical protein